MFRLRARGPTVTLPRPPARGVAPNAARSGWTADAWVRRLAFLFVLLALAWLSGEAVRSLVLQPFTVDENQYAHAAWLVANGQVPYRDFFEPHFPLVYQLAAAVFLLLGDDPAALVPLRLTMLPWLVGTLAAAWVVNGQRREAATIGVLCLLACPGWLKFATQLRPDPLAASLFLLAVAATAARGLSPARRSFASGAAFVLALWASQKALIYGIAFLPLLLMTIRARGRDSEDRISLRHLASGAALVLFLLTAYLASTRSFEDWWYWCFVWIRGHQKDYPGFSPLKELIPVLRESSWILVLSVIGSLETASRWWRESRDRRNATDAVLLAALPLTFVSFSGQVAPFAYSLVPFLAICCVFAGRGGAVVWKLASRRPPLAVTLLLLAVVPASSANLAMAENRRPSMAPQLAALRQLDRMTAPTDAVYDNTGCAIARPHVLFTFYTDAYLRRSGADALIRDVPAAIERSGCTVRIDDMRSRLLPPPLRAYLAARFHRYSADLLVWGAEYTALPGCVEETFLAPRSADYVVDPPEILNTGTLTIDGRLVESTIVRLSAGRHLVAYEGPIATFRLLWLPRDGVAWSPVRALPPSLGHKIY